MSLFSIFRKGLEKTSVKVVRSVAGMFTGVRSWSREDFDRLEDIFISSDFGVASSSRIVADLRDRYGRGKISTGEDICKAACASVREMLAGSRREIHFAPSGTPTVILMAGVNGSGKTTTIGKLASRFKKEGRSVILGACDTFRAAAVEQLTLWSQKTGAGIVSAKHGADPASVAYDAVSAAVARKADILLIDTAGRQQNQRGLMEELAKIRRSVEKALPGAPHEVWLTVDASLGSNVLSQAKQFSACCGVTGLVLTKLDGTGKGGMAVALYQECGLPVFFAGFGEQPEDLQEFDPEYFAAALFDRDSAENA